MAESEVVQLTTLKHYPRNARRGNVEVVQASLKENGQVLPLIVNSRNREVLAGNHMLKAMQALEWSEGLVEWVDADDEKARRINLVDNRASDVGDYDKALLMTQIEELGGDLDGTGWTQQSVGELFDLLQQDDDGGMIQVPRNKIGGESSGASVLSIGPTLRVKISKREGQALDEVYENYIDANHGEAGFIEHLVNGRQRKS